ncbi:RNA polymerase sigma factor [Anaeromicropila populeti]|uniref:RNA polymerase sigma-70 factor, ECF subfamily n=1 Tax=Anaeromicropila populeti TaxID=37658 RepID=A0A1I6IFL7_9FIRM|nr:sigma-70 family RNA polymerase sigma factor [Anaeromicropila populeti]SFR65444.1 RNA polymerase sigma-70 factor, ECF subfamily [Anaeromicropila populeti]
MNEEFQMLYEKYFHEIYLFVLKLVSYRTDLAEELTQEAFYQAFISLSRYRGECEIKTWLCQIAKNTCFKYFKKNPIQVSTDTEEFQNSNLGKGGNMPEEYFMKQELIEIVNKSILQLKKKYRDVLVYRLHFDMHFNEIGRIMNISENSAKVIYYRGKEMLKLKLEGYYYGK